MKVLRTILLALLASLITGLIIGTIIRLRLEPAPERYFLGRACSSGSLHDEANRLPLATGYALGLQGTSSTWALLFSARARTKRRSDRRFR